MLETSGKFCGWLLLKKNKIKKAFYSCLDCALWDVFRNETKYFFLKKVKWTWVTFSIEFIQQNKSVLVFFFRWDMTWINMFGATLPWVASHPLHERHNINLRVLGVAGRGGGEKNWRMLLVPNNMYHDEAVSSSGTRIREDKRRTGRFGHVLHYRLEIKWHYCAFRKCRLSAPWWWEANLLLTGFFKNGADMHTRQRVWCFDF